MKTSRESATYLYCLVRAIVAPRWPALPALPGTSPLRLLPAARDLWLVAADAPLGQYGGAPIERGLKDLEWVALRGAAHDRVVEHFARRRTTLPMKLFTLFTEDARALADVGAGEPRIRRVLDRVTGRHEWGVRVRLDADLARRQLRRRPAARPDGARAGTRFLLRKKHRARCGPGAPARGPGGGGVGLRDAGRSGRCHAPAPRGRAGRHAAAARRRAAGPGGPRDRVQAHHPPARGRAAGQGLSSS